MSTATAAPVAAPAPLDKDSPRGREIARDLTLVLDDVEEAIAARDAHARQTPET